MLDGSEEHGCKYLFWRMTNGVGHYGHNFKPGDRCFEITDYLFLPGDLSWVVGSAKEKTCLRNRVKDSSLCWPTNSRMSESWSPMSPQDESSRVAERRRSERLHLKGRRERHGNCVGHERETCLLCDEELSRENKNSGSFQNLILCRRCGRGFHRNCSGIKDGWADHWNLDCSHYGLDCSTATVQSKTETVAKMTNREVRDISEERKTKISHIYLGWIGRKEREDLKS